MKVLVALFFVAVSTVAADHGIAYSAYAPMLRPFAPYYMTSATPYAYGFSAPTPVMAPVASVVKTQYHMQNELGEASYGFSEPHHAQSVVQDAAGNKVGSFSFINADGKLVQTNYVAGVMGYRVESNDLPVAPIDVSTPVEDTPEVAEAKAKFFKEFEESKSRARRSVPVQTPADTVPLTTAVAAPIVPRATVSYTTPIAYSHVAPLGYPTHFPYSTPYSFGFGYPFHSNLYYSK